MSIKLMYGDCLERMKEMDADIFQVATDRINVAIKESA